MGRTITYTIIYEAYGYNGDDDYAFSIDKFTHKPYSISDNEDEEDEEIEEDYKPMKGEYNKEFLAVGMKIPKSRVKKTIRKDSIFGDIDHVIINWVGDSMGGCVHCFPLELPKCVLETQFHMSWENGSTCFYNMDDNFSDNFQFSGVKITHLENVEAIVGNIAPTDLVKNWKYVCPGDYEYFYRDDTGFIMLPDEKEPTMFIRKISHDDLVESVKKYVVEKKFEPMDGMFQMY